MVLENFSGKFITLATLRERWMNVVFISQQLSVTEESGSAPQTCSDPTPSYTTSLAQQEEKPQFTVWDLPGGLAQAL